MPSDELRYAVEDFLQAAGKGIARPRANHSAFDKGDEPEPVSLHDTITGVRRSGVDPENNHPVPPALAISATSTSKFAQTFCTSSRSSSVSRSLKSESASFPSILTVFFGTIASSASAIATPFALRASWTAWKSPGFVDTV